MSVEVDEKLEQDDELLREPALAGLLAQFEDVDSVMKAARHIRDAGYLRWDVHTPFPVHGMDEAMGIRPTILPWLVLGGGLTGLISGVGLQWYANVFEYPFFVSGKPLVSFPAWIPVIFELTILFASLTAVFGLILLNRLPRLYNPLFKNERFRRVTNDKFFVVLDAADSKFNPERSERMLKDLGATAVEWVEE